MTPVVVLVVTPGLGLEAYEPLLDGLRAGGADPVVVSFPCSGDAAAMAGRVRQAVAAVGPAVHLERPAAWNGHDDVRRVLLGADLPPLGCVSASFAREVQGWIRSGDVPLPLEQVTAPVWLGIGLLDIRQFSLVREDGEFHSADGGIVYREALGDVDVPMLFVAGRADRVVSPDRVWSYYQAVGSDEKSFVMASIANGMHGDYGHLDLGCGDHAKDDIFPLIVGWLK